MPLDSKYLSGSSALEWSPAVLKQFVLAVTGGGGGGGVQKTGDTMTGPLVLSSADGSATIDWEQTGGPNSIKLNTAASGWPTIDMFAHGSEVKIAADSANNLKLIATTIQLPNTGEVIQFQDPGGTLNVSKGAGQGLLLSCSNSAGSSVSLTDGTVTLQ